MSRTHHALHLVAVDEHEDREPTGDVEGGLDLALESGAMFGLHGPRGAVWASAGVHERDSEPPDTPEAA